MNKNLPVKIESNILYQIYYDLAHPSFKKLGIVLAEIVEYSEVILLPVKLINDKIKLRFHKRLISLAEEIEKIEENNLVKIRPEIGLPIIEGLIVTSDEQISSLYIRLLTTESNKNEQHLSHPNFVNIIKSITSGEAMILNQLNLHTRILRELINKDDLENIPTIAKDYIDKFNKMDETFLRTEAECALPFFFIYRHTFGKPREIIKYIKTTELALKIDKPELVEVYLDNLIGLGLLTTSDTYHNFNSIETEGDLNDGNFTKKISSIHYLSSLGVRFLEACKVSHSRENAKFNYEISKWMNNVKKVKDAKLSLRLGKTENSIDIIEEVIIDLNLKDELIQITSLSANFHRIKHERILNTIMFEDFNIEISKINQGVINLIDELDLRLSRTMH